MTDLRFLGCRIWHCTLFLLNLDHTFIFKACGETVYFLKSNIWTIGNATLDTHTHHSNPSPTLNNIHLGRQTEEGMESVSDCAGEAQDTHTHTHTMFLQYFRNDVLQWYTVLCIQMPFGKRSLSLDHRHTGSLFCVTSSPVFLKQNSASVT